MHGLGEVAIESARVGDSAWLMTLALCGALLAVSALVLSDIFHALLDPRARRTIGKIGRRRM
jgi:ABC-type dipeptide/oligopeptide/nickel transport system permease component